MYSVDPFERLECSYDVIPVVHLHSTGSLWADRHRSVIMCLGISDKTANVTLTVYEYCLFQHLNERLGLERQLNRE